MSGFMRPFSQDGTLTLAGRPSRPTRRAVATLLLAVVGAFLFAACSGGSSDSKDAEAPVTTVALDPAPDFEFVAMETSNYAKGETVRLSQFDGNPVVVNFWFPSCPPCRAEMPDLQASFESHRADGVEFVGVMVLGLDTVEDGQEFIEEVGSSYAIGPDEDSSIVRAYNVRNFPTTFFLNGDHDIVEKWSGFLTEEKLEELIEELLQ